MLIKSFALIAVLFAQVNQAIVLGKEMTDAEKCGTTKVNFATSMTSSDKWGAFKKAHDCRRKANEARKTIRDAAVEAY